MRQDMSRAGEVKMRGFSAFCCAGKDNQEGLITCTFIYSLSFNKLLPNQNLQVLVLLPLVVHSFMKE